jgi:hypothetical protein
MRPNSVLIRYKWGLMFRGRMWRVSSCNLLPCECRVGRCSQKAYLLPFRIGTFESFRWFLIGSGKETIPKIPSSELVCLWRHWYVNHLLCPPKMVSDVWRLWRFVLCLPETCPLKVTITAEWAPHLCRQKQNHNTFHNWNDADNSAHIETVQITPLKIETLQIIPLKI